MLLIYALGTITLMLIMNIVRKQFGVMAGRWTWYGLCMILIAYRLSQADFVSALFIMVLWLVGFLLDIYQKN